ncbi:hypothetical protein Cni_G10495 [Canna indica]|uniref:Uncharacterized protein n=1 Tax=Canna indica TaxID=4628 RepID=A0AAQ3K6R4_9LILI|nr:hypothetical protein Cni_G10495 [Canna indica]
MFWSFCLCFSSCLLLEPLAMATPMRLLAAFFLLFPIFSASSPPLAAAASRRSGGDTPPIPKPWPLQFHSLLYINNSGALSIVDLWYDWPNSRNFNIIQHQLGDLLYDLEWGNGTSFYYTLDGALRCRTVHFDVGILRPDWLDGATYLGQETVDGFLCNVWEKAQFIWYYEDVETSRPVHWLFHTGRSVHVMTFEVGAVLEDAKWQAPVYCFDKEEQNPKHLSVISDGYQESHILTRSLRGLSEYEM